MERSSDFRFWEDRLPGDLQACGCSDGDEIEFHPRGIPDNYGREASPFLSPASRLRVILDARRELMEMVKDMPESSYELSLKDMVEYGEELSEEETKSKEKMEARTSSQNSKSASRVSRSESMDSGVFLLKMFLPLSLSSTKKSQSMKNMKICPQPLSHRSEKQSGKDWWKIMSLSAREHKNREGTRRSKSRLVENENNSASSDWSLHNKKSRSSCLRGCLFGMAG